MDICQQFGIDFPLFAFSHCRDVVVEVSKAGGLGVLGAVKLSPEQLDAELAWIDAHVEGRRYGVDLIVPNKMEGRGEDPTPAQVLARLPEQHKQFAADVLAAHGVDASGIDDRVRVDSLYMSNNARLAGADRMLDVAFRHPIALIANALGVPPPVMLERGREQGVPVAALVGSKAHALRQVEAGVDLIIAAGAEAGGHCGDVPSLVLTPEVCEAVEAASGVPVLAAGGIVTGRQMAAAMAMGAAGVWCGSVWLTTTESETPPAIREKMLVASSRDTVRSRSRTGKFSRQLRSAWTDAWEAPGAPQPLPLPLQTALVTPYLNQVDKLADGNHSGARELATYYVGQGVGLMNEPSSVRATVQAFREDFLRAYERLQGFVEDEGAQS